MKSSTWRKLRQFSQVLALLLFSFLFLQTPYLQSASPLNGLFFRLNPLAAITAMLAGRLLIPFFFLSAVTLVFTLIFGRAWCGWLCPLGTILEWTTPRSIKKKSAKKKEPPQVWRKIKFFILIAMLFLALLGSQFLLFLDPITILTRSMAGAVYPALRFGVVSAETFLYQFKFLWPLLDEVHSAIVVPIFHNNQSVFIASLPIFLFLILLIALNRSSERFWCRYLCPLGGLLGWLSRLALLRREVSQPCSQCGLCRTRCPTGTIDPQAGFKSDPAECIVCTDCLQNCNQGKVAFRWQFKKWQPSAKQGYDPSRREVLAAMASAVGGAALAGIEPIVQRTPERFIRPPGALLTDFESLCIRCGECVRVCPTQGLQPALLEAGWQNLMTPHLVPRLGYCVFNCTACIQSCPSGAIPRMTVEEKHAVPMGLASIDRDRCLPWAYNTPCVVCEEMCPVPNKAIVFVEENGSDGQLQILKPRVIREKCIGCGVCENRCPVGGEAAIRVYSISDGSSSLAGL